MIGILLEFHLQLYTYAYILARGLYIMGMGSKRLLYNKTISALIPCCKYSANIYKLVHLQSDIIGT